MRVHLEVEAVASELEGKSVQFLDALAQALEQAPELAKALGTAAQGAREAAPARPGYPAMDALLERGRQVYVQRVGQMVVAIGRVLDRSPAVQKSLGPDGGWAELDEQVGEHLWAMLGLGDSADAQDLLEKAVVAPGQPKAGHKYLRRVPYTDKAGKRRYRYYYTAQAMGRQAQAGEEVRVGRRRLSVTEVDAQGRVTFEEDEEGGGEGEDTPKEPGGGKAPSEGAQGEQAPKKGKKRTVSAEEWAAELAAHYGEVVEQSMERRARQAVRAVTKLVPPGLLAELKGETDADRMEELAQRVPSVFERLKKAFQRAGIDPWRAKHVVARALARRGWADEGRAAAIGCVLSPEGSQLAARHVQLLDAAENLAGGRRVRAQNVQAAAELMQAGPDQFAKVVRDTAERAEAELVRLHQLLEAARAAPGAGQDAPAAPQGKPQPEQVVGELLKAALSSPAVKQLLGLAQAFPGLRDRAIPVAQQIVQQVPAAAPRKEPVTEGAATQVFVAGEGGRPRALRARYKLVEASDLQASHVPGEGFQANPAYPKDVQERAYHRDKQEQLKVLRNAKQLNPAFVANTNPDAVNGPPLVTASGVVLGGNSRTMSMQQAYSQHPEKAKELQQYLEEHAHEFGLKPEDVRALRSPVLVRVVDAEDQSPTGLRLLVRQFNESFTQSMDPRTMQVAMGRKLDERALEDLAAGMRPDETLDEFLGSSRAETFVQALYRAGVIDDRNSNQYVKKGTKLLNEDGKMLVGRVLVGRMVGDADLLSETRQKALESIANSVPSMTQAKVAGPGFDLSKPLAIAMSALNTLQTKVDAGLMKPLTSKVSVEEIGKLTRNFLQDLFGESHPVMADGRAMAMLEVFIRRPGPQQMARVFREYARLARENPEGQGGLFGASKGPEEVFRLAIETAGKREVEEAAEAQAAKDQPKVKVLKRKIGKKGEAEAAPEPVAAPAEPQEDTGSAVPASGVPEEQAGLWSLDAREEGLEDLEKATRAPAHQGGPYIGPRGGKWADPEHTIPWDPTQHTQTSIFDFQPPPGAASRADRAGKARAPLDVALSKIEDQIRGLDVEHLHMLDGEGKPIRGALTGTKSNVHVMPEILTMLRDHGDAVVTHNHPAGTCFSMEDIFLAVQWNLRSIRATTPEGVFVLERPEGGWLPKGSIWAGAVAPIHTAYHEGLQTAQDKMTEKLEAGRPDGPSAGADHPDFREEEWHGILGKEQLKAYQDRLGKEYGWEFRFEPRAGAAKPGGGGAGRPDAGQDAPARVPAEWEGEQQGLLSSKKKAAEPESSKAADSLTNPKKGDQIKVSYHPAVFGREADPATYHVIAEKGDQVQLSQYPDAQFGPWMPKSSVRQFVNDLAGKVEGPPSGNKAIDAVLGGKAKLLGKGDDGLAFQVGGQAVKVSTTVPYQPDNPGHRSPEGAADMLRQQVEVGNHLADLGVPGILRSEFVAHAGKGFQIREHVEIPEKLTAEQLGKVQDTLLAMHKHGFVLRDSVQVGLDARGEPVLFDTGKAAPIEGERTGIFSETEGDMDNLRRLYQEHGVDFVRKDKDEGEARWDFLRRQLPKIQGKGSDEKARLKKKIVEAMELRRRHARATLKGEELEDRLEDIGIDEEDAGSQLGKSLEKAGPYVGPKGGLWEDPQHTRHWDPKEHQGARRGAQLGLFAARAPVAGDSAQQVEAKQLPADVRPERPEEVGGELAGKAEPKPHPGGGRQDVAAEGQQGEPEIWTVVDVEDLRPLDFWSGKRLSIPAEALRVCERCGRQHAVVVTLHSSKGRSAEVGSGCGPALAGGAKYYDNEGQRKAERELKKKSKAAYLQKVKDWLESETAALEEKHLRAAVYPGDEVAMVPSKQIDAAPGEMRKVLRTVDGVAEVWFPAYSDLEERRKTLQAAWAWRVVHEVMQKLQAKGSDWRWPAVWPTKAPGMDALHAVAERLGSRLRDRLAKP